MDALRGVQLLKRDGKVAPADALEGKLVVVRSRGASPPSLSHSQIGFAEEWSDARVPHVVQSLLTVRPYQSL